MARLFLMHGIALHNHRSQVAVILRQLVVQFDWTEEPKHSFAGVVEFPRWPICSYSMAA